jgi:hypothetical protein
MGSEGMEKNVLEYLVCGLGGFLLVMKFFFPRGFGYFVLVFRGLDVQFVLFF